MNAKDILEQTIKEIATEVFDDRLAEVERRFETTESEDAVKLKHTLAQIMAKPFLRLTEAALLLNVSESQLRKQIKLAGNKKGSDDPIPFTDRLGIILFNREELIEWVNKKPHLKLVEKEDREHGSSSCAGAISGSTLSPKQLS